MFATGEAVRAAAAAHAATAATEEKAAAAASGSERTTAPSGTAVPPPASQPASPYAGWTTNVGFGGDDGAQLFVTTADGVARIRARVRLAPEQPGESGSCAAPSV